MDEAIDILDADGNYTGETLMKSEAHKKGLFHPSIHVWFYTGNGEILIQKRAKNKDTHPGLWDVSVAGHVGAGENVVLSAIREVGEEIGLTILGGDLFKVGVFKYQHQHRPDLIDREFHHTFLSELKVPLNILKMQESEVDDLALIDLDLFKKELAHKAINPKYVPYDPAYYEVIFQAIEAKL
ncbi:MAG TPA: NUDIX domain-containing protein [Arenibacter sp.]|nr:NUDIX domain-containing protein [Arenibacter sp.]